MAKDIMTSGIEMSDVIKTTGFPVPEDMEGKTFEECVSGGIVAEPLAVTENGVYTAPSGKAYSPVTVNVPSGGAFRYFDGRESGYASMPTGFWVIRKDQTSGNAHCLTTTNSSSSDTVKPIKELTSDGLTVDEYYRETFPEVTVDVAVAAVLGIKI